MIRRSSNDWYMYYVNGRGRPNRIEYIRSEDGLLWDRKAVNMPKIDNDPGFVPWHVDVFESGKIYYMLVCGMVESPNLYLATSTDLVNWTYKTKPIILPGKQTLDSTRIYRSTGLVLGKDLWVWFSYTNAKKAWGMGLVRLNLENL
jgi:predicted GH43/DUF377 family glycosyl hydrolase